MTIKPTSRLAPFCTPLFLLLWLISLFHLATSNVVGGQAITPFISRGNDPILRSFLEPCETITLQTQCSDDEYESNEDCLPQKTDNCNHSKELFCLSGVCLPNCHPNKELYDPIEGKCFRRVGSDCRVQNGTTTRPRPTQTSRGRAASDNINSFEVSQSTNGKGMEQHLTTTAVFPDCEKNAVCERGQCRCARNFTYDHNFNRCVLYAGYTEYCNDVLNCDRKSDIVCTENQCQCKSQETQYFHPKRKRCYIRVGQVCSSGLQFCPDNSNCVREKSSNSKNYSIISSIEQHGTSGNDRQLFRLYQDLLINGEIRKDDDDDDRELEHFIGIMGEDEEKEFTCKCDKGYGSTRDKRFCLGLHGARCNTLYRCNIERGLKCFNGTCLCERERLGEEVYSETFQTCITSIEASCIGDGKGEREPDICPVGASCKEGKCICDDGLSHSLSGEAVSSAPYTCMKSHGMPCKNNSNAASATNTSFPFQENDISFEPPCNFELGLECSSKDEKCLCKDSNQFYDMTTGKCKKFGGTDQKIPVIHFTPPEDREYTFKKNCASFHADSRFDLYMMIRVGILCSLVLFKPVLLFSL